MPRPFSTRAENGCKTTCVTRSAEGAQAVRIEEGRNRVAVLNPVLLTDGVPDPHHPLLRDRVVVHDPDDWESASEKRR